MAIAFSATLYATVTAMSEPLRRFLQWIEALAPIQGLSGLTILVVGLIAVLLFFLLVHWVFAGFAGESEFEPNGAEIDPNGESQ